MLETPLATAFQQALLQNLKKNSAKIATKWVERYRIDPEGRPWSFKYHPWTWAIHNFSGDWVSQKAAQMGLTETALNRALFSLDILDRDVLYILPKLKPDATDFSASRFNPALEMSEHLTKMFSEVNNVGLKRAGNRNLYIRGAQSSSGLKSIPASTLVWDELDEMSRAAIALGKERMSGKRPENTQDIKLSTPSIPEFGIAAEFGYSSQDHYFFRCPGCSKFINLELANLVITAEDVRDPKIRNSHLKCLECGKILNHRSKPEFLDFREAQWVPAQTSYAIQGFRINQLYSCMRPPWKIAESVIKSRSDPFEEKELHRSKLGIPFVPAGARVTIEEITACLRGHQNGQSRPQSIVTMGIDQGKWIHCVIDEWFLPNDSSADINSRALKRNLKHMKLASFEEIDNVMRSWNVAMCVIDANPERRKAYELSVRFKGRVFLCFYNRGITGKQMSVDTNLNTISVDRTSWLDVSLERFHQKTIELPIDTSKEYKDNIIALIKETDEDDDGNPRARYVSVSEDHYGHANNYSEMCLPLIVTLPYGHKNIKDVL